MVSFKLSSAFVSLLMVVSTLGYQFADDGDVVKRQEEPTSFPEQNGTFTTTFFHPQATTVTFVASNAGGPSAIVTNYTTIGVVSVVGPQNVSMTYSEPSNNNYTSNPTATGYNGLNSTASSSSNLSQSTDGASPPADSNNSALGLSMPHGAVAALGLMVSAIAFL